MAKALSPIRLATINRAAVTNSVETAELDFQLAVRQGVLIHVVEVAIGNPIVSNTTVYSQEAWYASLHIETGTLETAMDALVDGERLNSELIAVFGATYHVQNEAATRGGSAGGGVWNTPRRYNYGQMFGKALLVAQNVTARFFTRNSTLVVNDIQMRIWYQFVELTDAELASQFVLRR